MVKGAKPTIKKQADPAPKVAAGQKPAESNLTVSLKYWHTGSQCISDWDKKELTQFRKTIDKIQSLTASKLKNDQGLEWKIHKGKVAAGFSKPASMSSDMQLSEIRVTGKARLHGALFDGQFFLVWLDRNHAVFPEGK